MACTLLRTSAVRGSAFYRALSAAAAAPSGAEALAIRRSIPLSPSPLHRLFSSAVGDHPQKPLDEKSVHEKVNKTDQMQKHVQEINKLIDRDIIDLVKRYKELQAEDHGPIERFLTKLRYPKSKSRDDFIWRCELATIFALSTAVGYMLAQLEMSK